MPASIAGAHRRRWWSRRSSADAPSRTCRSSARSTSPSTSPARRRWAGGRGSRGSAAYSSSLRPELAEGLGLVGSGCGVLDGVNVVGEPRGHGASLVCDCRTRGQPRARLRRRGNAPLAARTQKALPSGSASTTQSKSPKCASAGLAGAEVDEPLHLGLHVGGAEVDVHAVLAGRGVLDLLERQAGPFRHGPRRRKTVVRQRLPRRRARAAHHSASFVGVGGVDGDVLCIERHAPDPIPAR